jgi:hypothetical protein
LWCPEDLEMFPHIVCGSWLTFLAGNELREVPDFHTEIEAKMRMNW